MDVLIIIIGITGFILAVILHEIAHGYVADKLGDPTARLMGRLSLNPIKHIDILGSVILPLTLVILRSPFIFGWAKPVPIEPYNLRNPKKDLALISLAGPLTNLAFAAVLSIFLRILISIFPNFDVVNLFFYLIQFNVVLAVFNLLPISPLDGSKILTGLLPEKKAYAFNNFMGRFGMILIFLLIFPSFGGSSLLGIITGPIINFLLKIFIPGYI